MVSVRRHKSDCRSTAGEDQQGLRLCGLEGGDDAQAASCVQSQRRLLV
jgi:hypothetical protein